MTALVTSTYGLDIAVYDQIAAGVTELAWAREPGFRSHAAYPLAGGFAVTEIWDDAASHQAFFEPRRSGPTSRTACRSRSRSPSCTTPSAGEAAG